MFYSFEIVLKPLHILNGEQYKILAPSRCHERSPQWIGWKPSALENDSLMWYPEYPQLLRKVIYRQEEK